MNFGINLGPMRPTLPITKYLNPYIKSRSLSTTATLIDPRSFIRSRIPSPIKASVSTSMIMTI